jgi:hypothetical protein
LAIGGCLQSCSHTFLLLSEQACHILDMSAWILIKFEERSGGDDLHECDQPNRHPVNRHRLSRLHPVRRTEYDDPQRVRRAMLKSRRTVKVVRDFASDDLL